VTRFCDSYPQPGELAKSLLIMTVWWYLFEHL
jgi:hypothetical protein